ncbi:MAG TPA: hypothetical protein DCX53_09350, partial [Anaerolineae bacterium]|nr:hypothetical protein [Anaerolineae bacterium]
MGRLGNRVDQSCRHGQPKSTRTNRYHHRRPYRDIISLMNKPKQLVLSKLLWMFLKVNVLSPSGPASIGLLYKEAVGTIMTEEQFVEAVGFSNVLPGSEALKLAMFVGFSAGGIPGVLTALLGAMIDRKSTR